MVSIYVTAPLNSAQDAAKVMKRLRASHYRIAVDWTKRKPSASPTANLRNFKQEIRAAAKCDVLVVLAPERGLYYRDVVYEMVIAHALKKPIVIVTPYLNRADPIYENQTLQLGTKYVSDVDKLVCYLDHRFR